MNKEKNDLKVNHHSHVMDYDNNEISVDHYKTDQYICIYCEQWNLQSSFDIQYYYYLLIYFHNDMWYDNTFTMKILDKCESAHPEYDILENISSSNEKEMMMIQFKNYQFKDSYKMIKENYLYPKYLFLNWIIYRYIVI